MSLPRVSVIMAAYNAENYISRAIDSVLQDKDVPLEIIVADDCSSDSTADVVKKIADSDPRVKLLRNDTNRGPSYSRNRAIAVAKGKWLAVLDADDEYRPHRLMRLLHLAEETGAEMVCDYLRPVDEHGIIVKYQKMYPIVKHGQWMFLSPADFVQADMPDIVGLKAGYLKPIIKRNVLNSKSIRYNENVRIGEDALLLFSCLIKGVSAVVTTESYYDYRQTTISLTRHDSSENYSTLMKVNQKMSTMAAQLAGKGIIALLNRRAELYECAVAYESFTRSLKKLRFIDAVRSIRFSTHCLSYFFKTFKQRIRMRMMHLNLW